MLDLAFLIVSEALIWVAATHTRRFLFALLILLMAWLIYYFTR